MKNLYFTIILLFSISILAQNNLKSGPMVGYSEMKEAVIWLQTKKKASVFVEYYSTDEKTTILRSESYLTKKDDAFTCHVLLDQLQPGKKYFYSVFIDKKKINFSYETSFTSKKSWLWRENAPDFSFALGSCTYINEEAVDRPGKGYGSNYSVFEAINSKNPDIMLWMGDNIYLREADWDTKTGIYHRYTHSRSIKELQPLLAKTQNFAIWDDHDFGPNDSDRSFYNKHISQQAFKDFWANKSYGLDTNQNEGTCSTFSWSDADFFLLDNRFFKSPNDRKTGEKTILGKQQLEWLIDALASSKAAFKIIAIGGQVLNSSARFENYECYKEEKNYFLEQIKSNAIKGVLFLSGDRHFTELSKISISETQQIYDWTVSPLTSNIATTYKEDTNINRVEGSLFVESCFGIISFSGSKETRQMKLTLFNKEGIELWNKVILKKELE
ncbi:alkaline phosphatase family protein [Flavobacterium franklandianum]|uniref:alkaline phosphatase D family protein n=1 Tax=Flavobacterium franklandianum TaxID=2594430 RepID=UPI00117A3699|nr:alkaline phosphatase D family protein [Flavobacterium franklandianum]TRX30070.1 alkaline phosphatase family protein [Flavobacterium franklandianum]